MYASPVVCPHDPASAAAATGARQVARVVSRSEVWAGALQAGAASPGIASLVHAAASRVGPPPCGCLGGQRAAPSTLLPPILSRVVSSTRCGPCPPLATGPGAPPASGLDHRRPGGSSHL